MTRTVLVSLLASACALAAYAAQTPDPAAKPNLTGTWQVEGKPAEILVIEHAAEKISIHDAAATDGKSQTEFKCGVKGAECTGRVGGEEAKLVFYFNGPALVQTTDNGKEVYRVIRKISDDGKKMTEERVPIVPPGAPETRTLVKGPAAPGVQSVAKAP